MSLVSTLGKVAMGVIVARGVGKMIGGRSNAGSGGSGGLGGLLGGLLGGKSDSSGSTGGLTDMIGGLAGKDGSGGLGGLLDSLRQGQEEDKPGFGGLFNEALQGNEPNTVSEDDEARAEILLRAMINAAKSDGELDENEKQKITEHLGDVSQEEAEFVQRELQAPLDLEGFIESVPRGMEEEVYLVSLLAIDLDSKEEAVYLDELAQGLRISHEVSNQIHEKLGAPLLYA